MVNRELSNSVRIHLVDRKKIRTLILRIENEGFVVNRSRRTSPWDTSRRSRRDLEAWPALYSPAYLFFGVPNKR